MAEMDAAGTEDADWESPPPQQFPHSGILTAGVWDDNLNLETFMNYRASLSATEMPGVLPIPERAHLKVRFPAHRSPRQTIDISFVIDSTGSMGDEMQYLQGEFLSLSKEIEERFSGSRQRWSLVVYRDQGDDYVVRNFDFEDSPRAFRESLASQSAGGGGDYPEAAHDGLQAALKNQWRRDPNTARVLYWVADAPHHQQASSQMAKAIHEAHRNDVHIYPIASSGVDELTELTMRSAAQLTGGRYIFLTDDSGVGLTHKEPTIPCYHVTTLRDAIVRTVEMEMRGAYLAPRQDEILRTSGLPDRGRCSSQAHQPVADDGWNTDDSWSRSDAWGRAPR